MLAKYDFTTPVRRKDNNIMSSPIDRIFSDVLSSWDFFPHDRSSMLPHHTMREEDGKLLYQIDLPGVLEKDLEINADDEGVLISGSREGVDFKYRLRIDNGYNLDKAEARLANGVLTLAIPNIEKPKSKKIKLLSG